MSGKKPNQSILFAEDSPVKTFQWPESEEDWKEIGQVSSGNLSALSMNSSPDGYLSKMYRGGFRPMMGKISESDLKPWANAGMVWRGECLTHSTLESPKDAVECSLSDILETHVHQRFYLSPKACEGILRRAEKRGIKLPDRLLQALKDGSQTKKFLSQKTCTTGEAKETVSTQKKELQSQSPQIQEGREPKRGCIVSRGLQSEESQKMARSGEKLSKGSPTPSMPQKFTQSVRRLTPTECERLQGFPDGWTIIRPQTATDIKD